MVYVSTNEERAIYSRIQKLVEQETGQTDLQINQKTLRLEQALSAAKNQYSFDIRQNKGSDRPQEVKLNPNDLFFITHLAICLTKQDETTTPKRYGNDPLFTFPDPQFFVGNDGANLEEFQALELVYNGLISIKTSPVERFIDFPTFHFRYVPERGIQKQAAPQINDEPAQYGPTLDKRGFFALTPNLILDGYDNNTLALTLGEGDKTVIAGGIDSANGAVNTSNVLVILLHGFSVLNGARKLSRFAAY